MALKDKNYLENKKTFMMVLGGNGDYVFQIWSKDKDGLNVCESFEVCTSGGYAPSEVKIATAELFRAMEKNNLNILPDDANFQK